MNKVETAALMRRHALELLKAASEIDGKKPFLAIVATDNLPEPTSTILWQKQEPKPKSVLACMGYDSSEEDNLSVREMLIHELVTA